MGGVVSRVAVRKKAAEGIYCRWDRPGDTRWVAVVGGAHLGPSGDGAGAVPRGRGLPGSGWPSGRLWCWAEVGETPGEGA